MIYANVTDELSVNWAQRKENFEAGPRLEIKELFASLFEFVF